MSTFEQEWVSPVLEVYKKRKLSDTFSVILGLNPVGQMLCRHLYERNEFESVLLINSPAFSSWNRYPADLKPPVVPVHGMIADELMIIFGDVIIKEHDWMTDLLFYLRGNVHTRFVISLMTHDGPTCGQVISRKGERLLKRMNVPLGRADFYDSVSAPLVSAGTAAGLDAVILFLEKTSDEVVLQIDDQSVSTGEIETGLGLLLKGLDLEVFTTD